MAANTAFDNEKYIQEQKAEILERVEKFDNKLYLEFGGKLLFDYHASRVLPGYDPNVKMRLLQALKDKAELLLCISASPTIPTPSNSSTISGVGELTSSVS